MDIRKRSVQLIRNIVAGSSLLNTLSESTKERLVTIIEASCYNSAISQSNKLNILRTWRNESFLELYQSILYRVSVNLDPQSQVYNNTLTFMIYNAINRKKIIDMLYRKFDKIIADNIIQYIKMVNINHIGELSSNKLNPLSNLEEMRFIELRSRQQVHVKTSALYLCKRCGKRETKNKRYQMRAGDEGFTFIIECQHCYNTWKENG
jgi:DNA-directed RNA polymerase subunit M/transcription elongation factor TFIIS